MLRWRPIRVLHVVILRKEPWRAFRHLVEHELAEHTFLAHASISHRHARISAHDFAGRPCETMPRLSPNILVKQELSRLEHGQHSHSTFLHGERGTQDNHEVKFIENIRSDLYPLTLVLDNYWLDRAPRRERSTFERPEHCPV